MHEDKITLATKVALLGDKRVEVRLHLGHMSLQPESTNCQHGSLLCSDCRSWMTLEGTFSELLLHEWIKSLWMGIVSFPWRLTDDHKDEDEGGHSCADVEHDSDVVRQLIYITHVWHKDGWDQEPNGNTHL